MNDKQFEELMDDIFKKEQELPEGLADRLESYIDSLAEAEEKGKKRKLTVKRSLYWIGSVAATLLIGLAIFFQTEVNDKPVVADTFDDPQEAAIAAQQALAFLSTQLNKGLQPVENVGQEIGKINDIFETIK